MSTCTTLHIDEPRGGNTPGCKPVYGKAIGQSTGGHRGLRSNGDEHNGTFCPFTHWQEHPAEATLGNPSHSASTRAQIRTMIPTLSDLPMRARVIIKTHVGDFQPPSDFDPSHPLAAEYGKAEASRIFDAWMKGVDTIPQPFGGWLKRRNSESCT